ncbi:MAG: phosphatidate cytidylyltransferase [Desulfobacterota bacterium]|nr:phosphatidate cytidylyltransferase [Thermodesulfobacteriota bacterium]MDW8001442.1 phosphatidate cytidylyltransferase [Deltaproteobacteria bacterium]
MSDLRSRLLGAAIFGPIVISAFYFLPLFPFFLFMCLLALISTWEMVRISKPKMGYLSLLFAMLSFLFLYFKRYESFVLYLLFSSLLFIAVHIMRKKGDKSDTPSQILKSVGINIGLSLFIIVPFYYLYALKELNDIYPLILLFTIWASDICAYFVGKGFGKHVICPDLSPKKTVEGLAGATFGASVVLVCFSRVLEYRPGEAFLLGIVLGLIGQAGDVFESALKRYFGIKDSSKLIPGHGGLLDRMDSFIFTAPLFYRILSSKS